MIYEYSNQYGKLTLEKIGQFRPVKGFSVSEMAESDRFDIETAEKVALITGNKDTQLGGFDIGSPTGWGVFYHMDGSTIAPCRIVSLIWNSDKIPMEEFNKSNPYVGNYMPEYF